MPRFTPTIDRNIEYVRSFRFDPVGFCRNILGIEPHEGQQKWLVNSTRPENALTTGNRYGKALAIDTPILTPNGWRPIGELSVGDEVYGVNGLTTTVNGVYPQGALRAFRVKFTDGASVVCNDEHLWTVRLQRDGQRTDRWRTLRLADMLPRLARGSQPNNFAIPTVAPIHFPSSPLSLDPYLLGLLLGDGGMTVGCVVFTTADEELGTSLERLLPDGCAVTRFGDDGYGYRIRGIRRKNAGSPVAQALRGLGLFGKHSECKFIPKCYLYGDIATRTSILQGLLDTDGSIDKTNRGIEFTSASEQLAKDVAFLVQSLGGIAKCTSRITACTHNGERVNGKRSYRVAVSIPNHIEPFRLARKAELVRQRTRYHPHRRIASVDTVSPTDMVCISVAAPDGLFVVNDFIVTHNSFVAAMKLIYRATFCAGWTEEIKANADRSGDKWEGMNIAPTAKQARLVYRAARNLLHRPKSDTLAVSPAWLIADEVMSPFPTITIINGASFSARSTAGTGDRLLGEGLDFITWDEAAREKKFLAIRDDVLKMRLGQRAGMLDYVTTGNGRNDYGLYFLDGLKHPDNPNLYCQSGRSGENPYWPPGELERLTATMSDWARKQNIEGQIIDAGNGFFTYEDLVAAVNDDLTRQMKIHSPRGGEEPISHCELYWGYNDDPDFGELTEGKPWHNAFPDHRYVHFWDLAEKVDWAVGITLDCSGKKLVQVEFERFKGRGWSYLFDRIRERHNRYKVSGISPTGDGPGSTSTTWVDATGVGDVAVDALKDINAKAFVFTKPSKDEILANLQSVLNLRGIEMPEILVEFDEVKFYERDDKELTQDCVMALAGAVFHGQRRKPVFAPFYF